jgi:hypothetical protein
MVPLRRLAGVLGLSAVEITRETGGSVSRSASLPLLLPFTWSLVFREVPKVAAPDPCLPSTPSVANTSSPNSRLLAPIPAARKPSPTKLLSPTAKAANGLSALPPLNICRLPTRSKPPEGVPPGSSSSASIDVEAAEERSSENHLV